MGYLVKTALFPWRAITETEPQPFFFSTDNVEYIMGNDEDDDEDVQFSQVVGKSQAQCTSESLILKMVTEVINNYYY